MRYAHLITLTHTDSASLTPAAPTSPLRINQTHKNYNMRKCCMTKSIHTAGNGIAHCLMTNYMICSQVRVKKLGYYESSLKLSVGFLIVYILLAADLSCIHIRCS